MTRRVIQLALAALVLHLLLIQPNHPAAMTWQALFVFPLELPVILMALIALPPAGWGRVARGVLVAVLMLIAVLKAADYAMFTALGRGFNPVADLSLIEAGLRLATGAIGPVLTMGAVLAALVAVACVGWALWWASGVWARLTAPPLLAGGMAAASILFAGVATAEIGQAMGRWDLPLSPPGAAFTARVGVERIGMARATLADLRAFEAAAANDPYAARDGLLRGIDRDVLIVFVESYGRTSLDTPLYAETHRATLTEAEARLGALGLAMRSGFLSAPTRGGQSWLSHATFANGLWIANQTSYGAVLASNRRSLFHIASDAGFRTAAVMPQITLDWPESERMGFETVLAARDLGYAGLPFNWVTMPDQFTFTALDRFLRDGQDERPLFAQLALGSSHAPWVPVPELVEWEDIDDGRIFDEMALSGDPPDVVWRDRDRVRDQYRMAVDYALRVVFDYAARHAVDPPLIFVVGDHQAAGFVALDDRPDVPVHVIGPEALVTAAAGWGWIEGLIPGEGVEVRSMADMRDMILDAYSHPIGPGGDS
jgi:hypothetical protein